MMRWLIILFVPAILVAQEADSLAGRARLSVLSTPDGAEVIIDSVRTGMTPLRNIVMVPGAHQLRIAYPSFRDWNGFQRGQEIHLSAGEELTTSFEFGTIVSVHTVPSGAEVSFEGTVLGTTPLQFKSPVTLRSALLVRKDGYEEKTVDPFAAGGFIALKPRGDSIPASEVDVQIGADRAERWGVYTSAAGIVVSGVAAAYFKRQADARFDQYGSSGSTRDLDATRRYDAYSAAALIATQVSFAVLTYLLLSE